MPSPPEASPGLWALPRLGQVPSLMAHTMLTQNLLSACLCPSSDSEPLTVALTTLGGHMSRGITAPFYRQES